MVQQDPDGHHGRGPSCHSRVHQDDPVVLDVLWKPQVVQLWKDKEEQMHLSKAAHSIIKMLGHKLLHQKWLHVPTANEGGTWFA